jgi:hypothetical protein
MTVKPTSGLNALWLMLPGSDNDLRIHKFPVDIWGTHRETIGIPVKARILAVLR